MEADQQAGVPKMKAIVIDGYGGVDQLHLRELPDPRPHADEVLVRVRAAGVNPVDWKIRQGQLRFILRPKFPFVPGGDIAGEVVSTGPQAAPFKTGDPVVGFVDLKRGGGYAELAAAKKSAVALKPSSLSFAEAASMPIAACTALQALRDLGKLSKGARTLILRTLHLSDRSGQITSLIIAARTSWLAWLAMTSSLTQ
jgi:NADPH:quinone reductase-like Zn-dependent oxidoreductase